MKKSKHRLLTLREAERYCGVPRGAWGMDLLHVEGPYYCIFNGDKLRFTTSQLEEWLRLETPQDDLYTCNYSFRSAKKVEGEEAA